MITIHREKETDFSKNGYGAIDDYVINAEVNWEMNGQFSAYLEYPAFLDKADYLVNKNILRVPVPFMDDQLFRIYRTRKVLGFIQVEARHIFYDLMDNLIEDTNIVGKNGSQALQQLLAATQYGHQFTGLSNITTTNNARIVRYNPVEALLDDTKANTFVSRWGGEIVRDNFIIRMAKQMGSDRGVHIQHKKDLLGYEATIDESTVVTRIMPIGFDGLKLPELYIDSPLIDLNNPKIKVIKYDDVKAAIGMYAEDEDAIPVTEAYALLRKYAKEEFSVNHLDEPETTVRVNFASLHNTKEYEEFSQLQEIKQGDVVKVSVPEEGFEITSRLVAFTSDPLRLNHYTSTTLGNHVFEFTSSSNDTTMVRNEVEKLKESVVTALQSANGKNRNFWGTADPNTLSLNASVGDNYFRENGEETTLYQYVELNGERYWKEILDTSKVSIVAGKADEAMAEAEQAKEEAQNAYSNALTDAVAEAERLDNERQSIIDGQIAEVISQADSDRQSTSESISNAISEAERLADEIYKYYDTALLTTIWYRGESPEMQRISGQKNLVGLLVETAKISKEQANKAYLDAVVEAERSADEADALIRTEIEQKIGAVESELSTAKQDAIDKANQALADAKAHAEAEDARIRQEIGVEISGAIEVAEQAKQDAQQAFDDAVAEAESKVQAKDAEYQSVFDTYDLALQQAAQDIQTSLSKADGALEEAGISTSLADTAKGLAEQAKQTADEAKQGAEQAKLESEQAKAESEQAKAESEQAKAEVATIPTKINDFIATKGLVDGNFVDEKVDEATGAWSLELARVESLVLPETFTVLTATWLRGENPQMNLSQIKNKIPQRGHVLYGAIWTKGHDPIMKRTTGEQALSESVSIFGAEYKRDVEGIYHELTRVESNIPSLDGYATQYWANEKFETAEKVQQTLSAYTEETIMPALDGKANIDDIPDLTPYAQTTWVQNQGYQTASEISTTLTKYTTETLQPALADKANLDDIPDISGKADKSEIPSLTGYAKESWVENKNYQTASEINQILTSYTKTTELNNALANKANITDIPDISGKADKTEIPDITGMVTESTLATKNYVTAGTMSTTLTNYLKTTNLNNKIQETTAFQDVKETTNRFTRVIGSTDAEAKTNIAQIAMTDQIFQTSVNDILDNKGYITDTTLTMSATWVKGEDPVMQRTSKLEELIRLANSAQSGVEEINQNIKLESIMGMTWFKRPSPRMQPINKLDALNSAVSNAHSKITQLADMIDLRVTADGLIGAINLQAGKTIFQQGTNKLMLTPETFYMPDATIESAQIKNLNASKIYGTSADFDSVRAGVLVTDAVESTHIKTSTAIIDKLFANETMVNRLTSKEAFIDSIKAVEIDAGKITSGTVNTERLNTSDIVAKGLTTNVVTSDHIKSDTALIDNIFATQALVDRLWAKTIWTNKINTISLDASQITAGTIDTARLDASNIVTRGLTANVVKSNHIEASTTLIDKLFATSALIGELTSKAAFIDSIKAVEIDASKITSGTINSARIDVVDLRTKLLTANVIKSTHIDADEALFTKLFTNDLATEKLATKQAWITNANISSLDASKITSGTIDTARLNASDIVTKGLTANVIKSTHILADNALFDKLFTNDLATQKLATKQAWIKSGMIGEAQIGTAHIGQIDASNGRIVNLDASSITSGTMTANRISGGTLTSTNGGMSFNLNTGHLSFQQDGVAIKNQFSGRPLQYLTFKTGTYAGSKGSYTALMSNSGNIAAMDENSAGIQIWNNFDRKTAITLYGNTITFRRNADVNVTEQIDIDTVNRAIKYVDTISVNKITNVDTINNLRIVPMSISGTSGVALMYGNDAGMWIGGYGDFAFKHNGVWIGKARLIN